MLTDGKTLGCLCCVSGNISASLCGPRTGFVSGERMPIEAEVDNQADRPMEGAHIKLKSRVDFHGSHGWSKRTEVKAKGVLYFLFEE